MAKQNQPQNQQHEPTIAPGLENDELLENATREEINAGESTSVTILSWDEYDPAGDDEDITDR